MSSPPIRKYSCRSPISAKAFAVKTMYGSWVRPKIAGIESSANSTSVVPMASMTTISGVSTRLPLTRMKSLVPWYLSATPNFRSMDLRSLFSSNSSSSSSERASWMSFQAV